MALFTKRKGKCKDPKIHERNAARAALRKSRPPSTRPQPERVRLATTSVAVHEKTKRRRVSNADERVAIKVLYHNLGSPEPAEWKGRNGTAAEIMRRLHLDGSPRKVLRTLEACRKHGAAFNPKAPSIVDCAIGSCTQLHGKPP